MRKKHTRPSSEPDETLSPTLSSYRFSWSAGDVEKVSKGKDENSYDKYGKTRKV